MIQMTHHAASTSESDDFTFRLMQSRQDAEMASGVLHNIGNALTPIAVKSSHIQHTLSALPTSDLQMVLNELKQCVADASRHSDLQEFLRLAAIECLKAHQEISADVKAIADGVLAIQAMLNDHARHARSGPVIEAVRLEDVVRQALTLVPPQLLSRVDVSIDESVAGIGTLLIAPALMQQVFQNVIVNACEAMRSGVRGIITISAHSTGKDGERKLQVMFSDNGAGIAPEHLPNLFNKGFSTKPMETHSGLGLHWSANVVASLGGRIYANSPGADGGAVFYLILPLRRTAHDSGAIAA